MTDPIKRDDALLPCPFCGGEASIHKGMVAFEDYEIHCDICGVCSPNFGALNETLTPQSDAIAAWNTRALPAIDPAAIREAALANQTYTYIGKDMKPILARDLEDAKDAAEAKLTKAVEWFKKLDRRGDALETFDPVVHEVVTAALAELEKTE